MLILGVRTESISGQECQIFFVQNWTRNKQFIEVSAEYLRKVHAEVFFVVEEQNALLTNLATPGHILLVVSKNSLRLELDLQARSLNKSHVGEE